MLVWGLDLWFSGCQFGGPHPFMHVEIPMTSTLRCVCFNDHRPCVKVSNLKILTLAICTG